VLGITSSTVQVHANGIRRKLGMRGTLELLAFAAKVRPLLDDRTAAKQTSLVAGDVTELTHPELIASVRRFVERYP
jgi:hypothetical protein